MKAIVLAGLSVLVYGSLQTAHAASLYAGQSRAAAVCSQCHGIRTPSASSVFPNLAGRDASYLETALKQYRDKTRVAELMNNIAGSLTDEDIHNVAEYYSKVKP